MTRPLPEKFRSRSRPSQLFRLAGPKMPAGGDFCCLHCRGFVSADPMLSGVKNRNHCPYCLWSRHLDMYQAGDRLAVCRAPMRPLGLSLKPGRNRYAPHQAGELMLVHVCQACGKVSLNRVAADDDAGQLMAVYRDSLALSSSETARFAALGVWVLGDQDRSTVYQRLQEVGYGEKV